MRALPFVLGTLCVLGLAYRYYSAFLAAKVADLDDSRLTPAHTLRDGQNYVPTNKWVLFGHHFAAITGAGPLDRADAGRAVRFRARLLVAPDRRCHRRRGPRLHHSVLVRAAQRQIARRNRAHGDRPGRGHRPRLSPSCSSSSSRSRGSAWPSSTRCATAPGAPSPSPAASHWRC